MYLCIVLNVYLNTAIGKIIYIYIDTKIILRILRNVLFMQIIRDKYFE